VLVTQCGCDTHRDDPLADLALTVDGQRTAIELLHRLAHDYAGGRWLALGGGGYNIVGCVPLTWTNLIAEMSGRPLGPAQELPSPWRETVRSRFGSSGLPDRMGELPVGESPTWRAWEPTGLAEAEPLDRSIAATRSAVFPLHGLDPDDPRD
jgi:acetoin utilization protein AcuC